MDGSAAVEASANGSVIPHGCLSGKDHFQRAAFWGGAEGAISTGVLRL